MIVISPFSNSDIRDWPLERYQELIGLLLANADDLDIHIVGTSAQRTRANEIVRNHDAARVHNDCGKRSWKELEQVCASARCVIANNSGVAHMAAHVGAKVVCIFGGSHQRLEWRPLGPRVTLITPVIECSPCNLDHGANCPIQKKCLWNIEAELVAKTVHGLLTSRL